MPYVGSFFNPTARFSSNFHFEGIWEIKRQAKNPPLSGRGPLAVFGSKVDLVSVNAVRPRMMDCIKKELINF